MTSDQIEITAFMNVVGVEETDTLEIIVEHASSPPLKVQLRAICVGDLITIEPELHQNLDLGQQFESLSHVREFSIKNCTCFHQRLVWTIDDLRCIQGEKNTKVWMLNTEKNLFKRVTYRIWGGTASRC